VVDLPDQRLHAAVKRRPLAAVVQRDDVFFCADRLHFSVHERFLVVVVAADAAVVAVGGPLEGLELAGFDEDVVCCIVGVINF
jgi:hypothetical protein